MENEHTYFFKPYVGKNYNDGFYNLRSLVVGVCHICNLECPHHDKCSSAKAVKDMDRLCPCYKDYEDRDYTNLSNSNTIEIQAFLESKANYPAYKSFTYYMLKCAGDLPKEKKCKFWDNVAFTNFLQYFHEEGDVLPKDPALFEEAYHAFKEVVDELQPEIIYAWSEQVRDCLREHKTDFAYIGKANMQSGIGLYVFSPMENRVTGARLAKLHYHLDIASVNHHIGWYVNLLNEHLGRSCSLKDEEKAKVMHSLANTLMDMVGDGILAATETGLRFNDSDKGVWTSRLKGIFLSALKDQYPCFERYFNPSMVKIFNEPHLATAKRGTEELKKGEETLARMIKRAFPQSFRKTFSKDKDKKE